MTLIAAGVSHRTAPVEKRELLAVSPTELPEMLSRYHQEYGASVILSTCNRTEIYVHTGRTRGEVPPAELIQQLARIKGFAADQPLPGYYALEGSEVAEHLFRVAAGVDSMVLGEGQILGQVRGALSEAHRARSLDAALSRLFHEAVRTGKRARAETDIARYAVSVSSAAVKLVRAHVPSLDGCRALVVGAGDAGKLAARALRDSGVREISVTSRTADHARSLADYLGGTVIPFGQLAAALPLADLVLTSSSARGYVIDSALVRDALARREAPITFMDVAVPRDIDPAVADIPGAHLFDIDDLQAESETNLRLREQAADDVHAIVRHAVEEFEAWLQRRRAVPTIQALVERADGMRRGEVDRTVRDLGLDAAAAQKLDRMTAAIVKKVLHAPIAYLRGADDAEEAAQTVRQVFGVEDD